jgi:hypothetical protein
MMLAAGTLAPLLGLFPLPRRRALPAWAEWFYEFVGLVAAFEVALLVHLRCDRRSVAAARCPCCRGKIDVRFDESGRSLSVTCQGGDVNSDLPVLVSPPAWWRQHVERPTWDDDPALAGPSENGMMGK